MTKRIATVSPSSFGFLYDECGACYYDDVLRKSRRPRAPFPTLFTTIDAAMQRYFDSGLWHEIEGRDLPFRIESKDRWIRSTAIDIPNSDLALAIRGVYDSTLVFEDGRRALCDFKTSAIKPDLVSRYARQLQAYAFGLENPDGAAPIRIDFLGLAVFEPNNFAADAANTGMLRGKFSWVDVPRDDARFVDFVTEIGTMLGGSRPKPRNGCAFCSYRGVA